MKTIRIEFGGYTDIEADNIEDAKSKVAEMITTGELTIDNVIIDYEDISEDISEEED